MKLTVRGFRGTGFKDKKKIHEWALRKVIPQADEINTGKIKSKKNRKRINVIPALSHAR